LRLFVLYGHDFGEKVVGNMVNLSDFCKACDLACTSCRIKYGCFAPDVCGAFKVPNELPELIDDLEPKIPAGVLPVCGGSSRVLLTTRESNGSFQDLSAISMRREVV
jgi:hypothetical protein